MTLKSLQPKLTLKQNSIKKKLKAKTAKLTLQKEREWDRERQITTNNEKTMVIKHSFENKIYQQI